MKSPIRIIIADDHQLFADGIFLLLKQYSHLKVIGTVASGDALIEFWKETADALILLDIKMPVMNGLEVLEKFSEETKMPKIIMLSTYADPNIMKRCKKLGASGYLLKNCSKEELYEAIIAVHAGQTFFPESTHSEVGMVEQLSLLHKLTKREKEILLRLKNGETNKMIAENLHLSLYTVETHRKHIMHKLEVKNPQGLIKLFTEELKFY